MNRVARKFARIAARARLSLDVARSYYTAFSADDQRDDAEFCRVNAHAALDAELDAIWAAHRAMGD